MTPIVKTLLSYYIHHTQGLIDTSVIYTQDTRETIELSCLRFYYRLIQTARSIDRPLMTALTDISAIIMILN